MDFETVVIGGFLGLLLVLILTIGTVCIYDDVLVARAVAAGADPIKASCAIRGITSMNQLLCENK